MSDTAAGLPSGGPETKPILLGSGELRCEYCGFQVKRGLGHIWPEESYETGRSAHYVRVHLYRGESRLVPANGFYCNREHEHLADQGLWRPNLCGPDAGLQKGDERP